MNWSVVLVTKSARSQSSNKMSVIEANLRRIRTCVSNLAGEGASLDGLPVELDVDGVGLGDLGGEGDQAPASSQDLDMVGDLVCR